MKKLTQEDYDSLSNLAENLYNENKGEAGKEEILNNLIDEWYENNK